MKITVIGSLCLDTIYTPSNHKLESYGGIYFCISSLASFIDKHSTVYPVFGVNENNYDELSQILKKFETINRSGIYKSQHPTNNVTLRYEDGENRIEQSPTIFPPVPFEKIEPFLNVDGILINMISGFDIELDTLKQIRKNTNAVIHIDVHSFALGRDNDGKRFYRYVENWKDWLSYVDTVQMNEIEAKTLAQKSANLTEFAEEVMSTGVKAFSITKSAQGIKLYHYDKAQKLADTYIKANEIEMVDPTGCGDTYSSGFIYHYLKTHDAVSSARFANDVAGFVCTIEGSKGIERLKSFR